jgi:hypothetical protein
MVRVRASDVLRNVNFDKAFDEQSRGGIDSLGDQSSIGRKKRFGLRGFTDTKKNKSIFRDLSRAIDEIEEDRLNEEGPILTSKLEGNYTSGISRKNNPEMERSAVDQIGGGRRRKYVHHDKQLKKIAKICEEIGDKKMKSPSGKKRGRKKKKKKHHKKKKRGRSSTASTGTTRRKTRKTRKSGKTKKKKHHFKRHNIFRD